MRRLVRRLRAQGGYTLVELIAVMAILMIILTALTSLFVSGARAELEANRRFQAQQEARIAADRLRREVHCASNVTVAGGGTSVSITLPSHCATAVGGVTTTVVYATEAVAGSTQRFRLKRNTTAVADYFTSGTVFSYGKPSGELGMLHLDFPVNVNPNEGWKQWRLQTDIVLRNTTRT
jgi:prepilin-type N-terminal cleavage/methylation domain-containing protein